VHDGAARAAQRLHRAANKLFARLRARFDEALSYYSRAESVTPRQFDVLYGMGVCYSYKGQQDKAAELFRQSLRVDPKSAPAHLALGISLLQTGKTEDAVTELQAAAALEPRMRQAYYQLGRAYRVLGRTAEADAATAKVQELIQQELAEASIERP
jgi:tetratricopeptide (TPR) repeat protein